MSRFPLRKIYSALIAGSGLAALQRRRRRGQVTILTYHGIDARPFAEHLAFLARAYHILPLSEALAGLDPAKHLPPNPLAITFDDGFRSFYTNVYPALQRVRVPATVFLTTGYIGSQDILWFNWIDVALDNGAAIEPLLPSPLQGMDKRLLRARLMRYLKSAPDDERLRVVEAFRDATRAPDMALARHRLLTWDEAREMQGSGLVSFGGHTRTHPILARATTSKAQAEVTGCAADLERELDRATRHFAYPNGEPADFNSEIKQMVRAAGFASAVSAQRGFCVPGDDRYALRRIAVDGSFSVAEVAAKLSGLWAHLGQGSA